MDDFSTLERFVSRNRRDTETGHQFITRVADQCGLAEDDIETVKDAYQRQVFSPDPTPTADDQSTVETFLERAESVRDEWATDEGRADSHASMESTSREEGTASSEPDGAAVSSRPREGGESSKTSTAVPSSAGADSERSELTPLSGDSGTPTPRRTERTGAFGATSSVPSWLVAPFVSLVDSMFTDRTDYRYVTVLALFGSYIYYFGLGTYPLRTWDEGVYAEAAKNILLEGAWLAPPVHYHGTHYKVFMLKPPGGFWIEAVSMGIFGVNEFGVRFPSATAAILVSVVLYIYGRRLYDRRAGFLAGLVWLFGPYTFAGYNAGRFGGLETLTILVGVLFVYATWRLATDDEPGPWYVWVGLFAALAVLIKGFAAGIYVLVVLPLVVRSIRRFIRLEFLKTVVVTAAVSAPWFVYMHFRFGERFVDVIFFREVLGRAGGELATAGNPTFEWMLFPYFKSVPFFFDPWIFFLLPAAVVIGLFAYRRHDFQIGWDLGFLVWWLISVFGFFAFTGNNSWYLLPSYVAGALLVGILFSETSRGDATAVKGTLVGLGATLLFSTRLAPIAPFSIEWVWWMPGEVTEGMHYLLGLLAGAAFLLATPRAVAHLRAVLDERERDLASTVLVIGVVTILMTGLVGATPPAMNQPQRFSESKALGLDLRQEVPDTEVVYFENGILERTGSMFHVAFYSRRSHARASLTSIHDDGGVEYVVIRTESLENVDREYRVLGRYRITATTTGIEEPTVAFIRLQ